MFCTVKDDLLLRIKDSSCFTSCANEMINIIYFYNTNVCLNMWF